MRNQAQTSSYSLSAQEDNDSCKNIFNVRIPNNDQQDDPLTHNSSSQRQLDNAMMSQQ